MNPQHRSGVATVSIKHQGDHWGTHTYGGGKYPTSGCAQYNKEDAQVSSLLLDYGLMPTMDTLVHRPVRVASRNMRCWASPARDPIAISLKPRE